MLGANTFDAQSPTVSGVSISQGICQQVFDQTALTFFIPGISLLMCQAQKDIHPSLLSPLFYVAWR